MATSVAAILIRREREIVEDFRAAGATTPERARALSTHGVAGASAARRLERRAVLREAAPGLWWLDEPSWEARRNMRHRIAVLTAVAAAIVVALGVIAQRRQAAAPATPAAIASPASPAAP